MNQIPIFHHLPKCGGTSVLKLLADWFKLIPDYRQGWATNHPARLNLDALTPEHCLCGHFELDGFHLDQRYPGLLENPRFWAFSFIRDPLEVKISLFRYEMKNNIGNKARTIEKHLSNRKNYLAGVLGVGQDDFKTLLDKYAFIGVLEKSDISVEILAWLLGKNKTALPWENKTFDGGKRSQDALPKHLIEQFEAENELDYAIYNYAIDRLNALKDAYQQRHAESRMSS
ncbi:MAG: sulfotransferase family 2 domain-containing protein [Gammaproteobacteria bacterium]|nr:sulfotransferase family 2 domain-containing protein [Gammaproteobacteria bacterium]